MQVSEHPFAFRFFGNLTKPFPCFAALSIAVAQPVGTSAKQDKSSALTGRHPTTENPVVLIDSFDNKVISHWKSGDALQPANLVLIHAHASESDMRPKMPELKFSVMENLGGSVEARLKVDYPRGNGERPSRGSEHDKVSIPTDGGFHEFEGNDWEIHKHPDFRGEISKNGFFGGNATITYRLPGMESTKAFRFRIGGENPIDEKCKKFIQSFPETSPGQKLDFMYAIARHESKAKNRDRVYYNQFLHLGTHPNDGGFPSWNNDGGLTPGGYGVFQVTGTAVDSREDIRRDEIWNWQSNVKAAFAIMTHQFKGSLAKRYFENIKLEVPRGEQLFEQCPPPRIRTGGETFTAKQAVWITAYNGWGGPIKNRFVFSEDKPCGLGEDKRWEWAPPVKPSGKTYLRLVAEEMDE